MPVHDSEACYVPNMGIKDFMIAPIDLSFLYQDIEDTPLPISLCIKQLGEFTPIQMTKVPPTSRHWCIVWQVKRIFGKPETSTQAFRALHIVRERDRSGMPCRHLTNWGPMTKVYASDMIAKSRFIQLGSVGLEKRRRLEEIARSMKVKVPDGGWNSQDWIMSVLRTAVQERVLDVDLEAVRRLALQP